MVNFEKKIVHFTTEKLASLEKIYRLNLINSCTGFKSANLLGTLSKEGQTNVAVFSSITHLGSKPPLVGFVLRPTTVPRDTYKNIKETQYFTVNHIHADIISDAHHTSASYPYDISEFDQTNLEPEYLNNFHAPYVKGCKVQLGCQFLNEYEIKENNTLLLVSRVVELHIDDAIIQNDGWLDLTQADTVTINGLDGYARTEKLERFSYQKPKI